MDILSVNCPHTPATYHLINRRRLGLMQPHAYIVNTARGEVIDEQALIEALREKRIAGAGLDVYEHEPQVNPELLALDNAVLLPHMGSATIEGRRDMGDRVIVNIRSFADGLPTISSRPPGRSNSTSSSPIGSRRRPAAPCRPSRISTRSRSPGCCGRSMSSA